MKEGLKLKQQQAVSVDGDCIAYLTKIIEQKDAQIAALKQSLKDEHTKGKQIARELEQTKSTMARDSITVEVLKNRQQQLKQLLKKTANTQQILPTKEVSPKEPKPDSENLQIENVDETLYIEPTIEVTNSQKPPLKVLNEKFDVTSSKELTTTDTQEIKPNTLRDSTLSDSVFGIDDDKL